MGIDGVSVGLLASRATTRQRRALLAQEANRGLVGQWLANGWPMFDYRLANCWPIFQYRLTASHQRVPVAQEVNCGLVGQQLTNS